jgi:homoserine kinase type II
MAVYTHLEFDEIEALVAPLSLGRLVAAQGIDAGVENTTYFLDFASDIESKVVKQYVLTLAESLLKPDLEFIATFMYDLHAHGLPVPAPVGTNFSGKPAILLVRERPALLVPKIAGVHPPSPTPNLCRQMGSTLAQLHLVSQSLDYRHQSHRSLDWVISTGEKLLPKLTHSDRELLNRELDSLSKFVSTNTNLSQAIIHGDLFRDNVLIKDGALVAVIDFFSAGTGYLMLDLAIAVNDWCVDTNANKNINNYNALIEGYCLEREPTAEEIENWSHFLRIAALRFWVSRLNEKLTSNPQAPVGRGKDPLTYRQLVSLHQDSSLQWTL